MAGTVYGQNPNMVAPRGWRPTPICYRVVGCWYNEDMLQRVLYPVKKATTAVWKRLWPFRIGPHIIVMISAAVGLAVGLGWLFGIQLPTAADHTAKPFEGIKLVLAVVAGIGGIVALTVAYRKQKLGETADARLDAAEQREQAKHFHERFGAATEQLGSDSVDIRTAGVYALAHLADDWDDGRQTCINVLCAHIRKPYTPPIDLDNDAGPDALQRNEARRQQRQVRHTILDIIGERLRAEPKPETWHGKNFDFSGATIDGGNLRSAKFTGGTVNFDAAEFTSGTVNFRRAKFTGGIISFNRAKFTGGTVNFHFAKFTGGTVAFRHAEFTGGYVDFSFAKFTSRDDDCSLASVWPQLPAFDDFPDGPPQGLLLPLG